LLARIITQALGRRLPNGAPLVAVGAMIAYALLAGAWAAALRAAAMGMVVIAGRLRRDSHGRSWLIQAGGSLVAVVPPETSWSSLPPGVDGAIFTSGGPPEWQGPGQGFSAVQVAPNSRDGLPVRAFLGALAGAGLYRTDRLGTVELLSNGDRFRPADP